MMQYSHLQAQQGYETPPTHFDLRRCFGAHALQERVRAVALRQYDGHVTAIAQLSM